MIYTAEHDPPHVHAVKVKDVVVFQIDCQKELVAVGGDTNLRSGTVRQLQLFVSDNLALLCEAWRDLHGDR